MPPPTYYDLPYVKPELRQSGGRGGLDQPLGRVEIDWTSPQAVGLERAFRFTRDRMFIDVVSGTRGTLHGDPPNASAQRGRGRTLYGPLCNGSHWGDFSCVDAPYITAVGMAAVWVGYIGNVADYHHLAGKHVSNGATNNPFDFRTDGTGTKLELVRAAGGGANYHGHTSIAAGVRLDDFNVLGFRVSSNAIQQAPDFFMNGVWSGATSGGASGAVAGQDAPIRCGLRDDAVITLAGIPLELRLYNRTVPDGVFHDAWNNPWSLYRRPRRAYFDLAPFIEPPVTPTDFGYLLVAN